ncbi:MAG: armadillo-type fold-containing protein [Spirulinaceae cyanobacterium RM2_2_10]|nr:armadillo-type fold-containing protein [Spirulinaceae cyanobacterium SM2_1_0]NJO19688.1 armadillo-type fold-containing protein [Spirulinaceae cyanobacterium RM2_2_10]
MLDNSVVSPRQPPLRPLRSPILVNLERQLHQFMGSRQSGLLLLWGGGAAGTMVLLAWNWKLVAATGLGAIAMRGAYSLQTQPWSRYWAQLYDYWQQPQRQLVIAVGAGSLATLGTYIALTAWVNAPNRWVAVGAIAQAGATLLTLGLLSWQVFGRQLEREDERYERLLLALTAAKPLQRLIAIRQLRQLSPMLKSAQRRELREYFRLLLTEEPKGRIRAALLDSLRALDSESSPAPLQMPLRLERSPQRLTEPR